MADEDIAQLMAKYKQKLSTEMNLDVDEASKEESIREESTSREYLQFKKELTPTHISWYENACNWCEKTLKIKPDEKKYKLMEESIKTAHLNITPTGAQSFAMATPIAIFFLGSIITFILIQSMFFVVFFLLFAFGMMGPLVKLPMYMANSWRMKASNQMVLCIFYVVTYMRHTSNLELGIQFASEHLTPPLSLDLKKILWNVETEKYSSIKESLDAYLEGWKKYSMEFIEAFHLIESSLYEESDERRLDLLDKSLDVILNGTYEKMLHYAQNLKSPITMLNMMGIILPILGLVILPLVVSFMEGVHWYHISALYNILLPIGVFYIGKNILSTRPTGYGDSDASGNKEVQNMKNVNILGKDIKLSPKAVGISLGVILFMVGLIPIIMGSITPENILLNEKEILGSFKLLGYKHPTSPNADPDSIIGPFGLGASLLSLFIPLALGLGLGLYFKLKSTNVLELRNKAKKLEAEFASALFQLGNRLGDGIPAEMAFGKVADIMEGTISGDFFAIVDQNIRRQGMGIKQAIFNKKTGAVVYFPSSLIKSSMKVLIQSIKKGPKIAAQALLNISRYIKEIHSVNERLRDLMAEIISSMNSQIKFLTPAISGIVIGITSMITSIIGKLGGQIQELGAEAGSQASGLSSMFGDGLPTYYFQFVVGIYVVQLTYILTIISNGIQNGSDKVNERYTLGKNLVRSTILYIGISLVVMVIFNIIAIQILGASLKGG